LGLGPWARAHRSKGPVALPLLLGLALSYPGWV